MQDHGRLVSSAVAAAALSGAVGVLAACSSSSTGSLTSPAGSCTYPYGVPSPATDTLAAERQACTFAKGALTSQTIGGPVQSMDRLEHVVVVMLENRSFDHYFSDLPSAMGADVAGADTNPDGHGGVVTRYHEPGYCEITGSEPQHEWGDAHLAYSAGKMDGFVAATGAPTPMGYSPTTAICPSITSSRRNSRSRTATTHRCSGPPGPTASSSSRARRAVTRRAPTPTLWSPSSVAW